MAAFVQLAGDPVDGFCLGSGSKCGFVGCCKKMDTFSSNYKQKSWSKSPKTVPRLYVKCLLNLVVNVRSLSSKIRSWGKYWFRKDLMKIMMEITLICTSPCLHTWTELQSGC